MSVAGERPRSRHDHGAVPSRARDSGLDAVGQLQSLARRRSGVTTITTIGSANDTSYRVKFKTYNDLQRGNHFGPWPVGIIDDRRRLKGLKLIVVNDAAVVMGNSPDHGQKQRTFSLA